MSLIINCDHVDKNGGDGNATVTIKGASQDAQDAKQKVLDLVGSQRTYENRGSHRGSDSQNRGSNRSDGNRDYGSQRNQQNSFGSTAPATNNRADSYSNSNAQQNNDTSEPMEYEMIDWQAAARESVCI